MIGKIVMADDGTLSVKRDNMSDIVTLPSSVLAALGLYDEAWEGFDYEVESDTTFAILQALLTREGYAFVNDIDARKVVGVVCEPGPGYETLSTYVEIRKLD